MVKTKRKATPRTVIVGATGGTGTPSYEKWRKGEKEIIRHPPASKTDAYLDSKYDFYTKDK